MKSKIALVILAGALVVIATHYSRRQPTNLEPPQKTLRHSSEQADSSPAATSSYETTPAPKTTPSPARERVATPRPDLPVMTNKLERLAQIRETFHALAAGDPTTALRAAKEISDGTERETALLTLVTEWTHGELRSPLDRAGSVSLHGLEAGLGMELVKNPELAILWANEMTVGPGRAALIQQTAIAMTSADPAAAFALVAQLPEAERTKFFDSVFAGWAENDTGAALDWAKQLADPAERDAAIQSIRSVAPVGIGAALRMDDGYAVINQLLPGTPAELSGQLHAGDRILALAQGDNSFVDAHGMALKDLVDMVRGAPGTVLQLQVLSADSPPGSQPQVVSITRDQIKFKR